MMDLSPWATIILVTHGKENIDWIPLCICEECYEVWKLIHMTEGPFASV